MRRIGGSNRMARLGVVASTLVVVALVAACQVGASTYGPGRSGATLLGNPLVVTDAGVLIGGQQQAAEEAKLANPVVAVARERSRDAYLHLTTAGVRRLLVSSFPALVQRQAGSLVLPAGVSVAGYATTHAARLNLPGHQLGVAESTWPLARHGLHGRLSPIDLSLIPSGSGYAPVNSDVTVHIPSRLATGISTPANGVTVTPVDLGGRALTGADASVAGASVVYANTEPAVDTVVKPTPTGFQLDAVLRSVSSPQQLFFHVGAPKGAKLAQDPASGIVRVVLGKTTLASILPPSATDTAGTAVPASMSVSGDTVVVHVDHRSGSYLYPIYVDPEINDSQLAEGPGSKRPAWVFKSSNEAKFGHKSLYEGAGKEHLETTGTAEYKAGEIAYWAYSTQGNSKIYELKTKTSAKNKLALIESILQFQTGATNENQKMLSNEFEEPEYSEKVSTICAWNASKVEECLAGAGKETNTVRFMQAASGSPGANYKFSDIMNEGIVSISEPAGEHSTTKFNTTSPEVEGEVIEEGKKVIQKRKNALYGAGIWLTKFKGALQFIAEDPGVGVAKTHLEYEKSGGGWETLSEHNYLEESLCVGIQCFKTHNEYWTVDPKLPDGEDKIRYRASEAISGTESLSSEVESTKTVKVDTSKPHNVMLGGLPPGNELSERKYKLIATAIDGTGTTVASSGIEKLELFVEGHKITEHGTQTGCSVPTGECTAKAEWEIEGAELGAGHHAIVIVVTDKAGNEARGEETISVRHSTPVALGPGSVDLQSGDYALGATDINLGSGLTVSRNYSSRATKAGDEGPLGSQWNIGLGPTESIVEMVDKSVLLSDAKGEQTIFASLGSGKFESPVGDSNLKLTLEENEAKVKLAYYLEDTEKHTKTKFTLPSGGTTVWVPTKQEGTVATDTLTYSYRTVEHHVEYPVPTSKVNLTGLTTGPEGNIWYTENESEHEVIGKMSPSGVVLGEWAIKPNYSLGAIVTGPDENIWVVVGNGAILKFKPTTNTFTSYSLPTGSNPTDITAGPDGNLWFTESGTNKIAKITTAGVKTEYALPAGSGPEGIAVGADENLWFTEWGSSKIGKITTSGAVTEYALPASTAVWRIAQGSDKNMWFTEAKTNKIGKITTSGTITEYALPASSEPTAIAAGPDKNVWFVESKAGKIGKISTSGSVTEFSSFPANTHLKAIMTGPDGNMWYQNNIWVVNGPFNGTLGTMKPSGTLTEPTEVLAPVPAGVSCSPEMKAGCRALKFSYDSTTQLLKTVSLNAYEPVAKKMQETAVAEYSYNEKGWLSAEWDPRTSPALKTTYGYDEEGHVTALNPPGQEPWAFTYGTVSGDLGTGRLLKVARAGASEALWSGESVKNTEKPVITGSAVVGVRMTVSDGKWTGSPITYGYQWMACISAESCTRIPGASNANYTPTTSDEGHTLVAVVTATNGGGSVTSTSAATGTVGAREFSEFALPAGSHPFEITSGPDGNLWFTDISTGKVGKITTSGAITEYATEKDEPEGITTGPDQNLWFVEHSIRHVNHITTSGALTVYTLTKTSTYNVGIVKGPDGNLWFTEEAAKIIGKINTNDEVLGEYSLPASSKPYGITAGPDGNLWFVNNGTSKVGKITTSGTITEYALPASSNPYGIASGPDGNLWFTNNGTNKVGKITTSGTITEYALPASSAPRGLVSYSGSLWVAEYGTNKIAKVTTGGTITQYSLPASSQPNGLTSGPDGYLWVTEYGTNKILRFNQNGLEGGGITEGSVRSPAVGYALEYGVPLTGTGLPTMTPGEIAKWGQTDEPVEGAAILPPDADQGWPASNYKRATIYYLDDQGSTVNVSSPSTASYGAVSTTEYNEFNDVERSLSADNRQKALEAGSESVDVAKSLSTYYSYRSECSKVSENRHETESSAPGARLCDVEGPQHTIKYMAGSEQKESLGRLHTKYFYDEEAPGGETYNLQTTSVTLAELSNEAKEEVEGRVTKTSYSGQSNLGWKLRTPTSVTVDPEGKKLTSTTLYNSSTAQITETRAPAGSGGGNAHVTKFIYYTAAANSEYTTCGTHPEWAGLLCETLPAKQPVSGGLPQLPVTTVTYNMWNEPLVMTETFGSTVRTKTKTYNAAGKLVTNETTSSANTALPTVTNEYNSKTGILEKQSTTVAGKTTSVTSKFDNLGHMTEYTDADGNIAKYRYGSVEKDGLLEEMTDGSNGGTGKQTYTYNATTMLREELWDSAAGTFTASYDAEGNLASEVYPNAMCANYTHNATGEATHVEYIKTTNCSESGAPVWFSETRSPSVRGDTFARSSTLASESYAYDTVGQLIEAHETPSGEGCTTRLYAYDEESNRTSQTTRAPGSEGKCATEGGSVQSHTYDEGNRLTDGGISYDSFANVTKLSAADAEGHELTSTFYVDNAVASQSQNGVTNNYYLDPEGRVRETVTGVNAIVSHYDGPGDAVVWTSESEGKSTRNIAGIDGALTATQTNGATPVLQLHDLQGNVVATAALSTSETKLLSTYNSTEFGVPNAEKTPPKFAWLGAVGVASSLSSGVITYGATSYVPQTGRPLQSEQVEPPGAPHGSGGGAPYVLVEDPAVFQGAAARGAEAPGLEAARERAAIEAALAAAVDPIKFVYMNKTKAREKAAELAGTSLLGQLAEILDIPETLAEAALTAGTSIGMDVVYNWFEEASGKLWKCGNNKWNIAGVQKVNICRLQYDVIEITIPVVNKTIKFVNFADAAYVWECFKVGDDPCFHEVFVDKKEDSCALGFICIASVETQDRPRETVGRKGSVEAGQLVA